MILREIDMCKFYNIHFTKIQLPDLEAMLAEPDDGAAVAEQAAASLADRLG